MGKTIKMYIIQVVVSFFVFGFTYWLIGLIFDKHVAIDMELVIQSAGFALIYSAYLCYEQRKKDKSNSEN